MRVSTFKSHGTDRGLSDFSLLSRPPIDYVARRFSTRFSPSSLSDLPRRDIGPPYTKEWDARLVQFRSRARAGRSEDAFVVPRLMYFHHRTRNGGSSRIV